MRIDDDDFCRLRLADTAIPAQTQHVLGMAHPLAIARNRLNGEEREPSFPAQPLYDLDSGDVNITLRAAVMGFAGKDGRDVTVKGFVVEGFTPADLVRVAAEPGSETIGHCLDPHGFGLERSAALQPWPSPRPGGARSKGGRDGGGSPGLHGTEERRGGRLGIPSRPSVSGPLRHARGSPLSNPPGVSASGRQA